MAKTFWRFFLILFVSGLFLFVSIGGVGSKLFRDQGLIPPHFVHSSERVMRRGVILASKNKVAEYAHFATVVNKKRQAWVTVLDEFGNVYGFDENERKDPYRFDHWDTQELPIYKSQLLAASVTIVDKYEMPSGSFIAIIQHERVPFLEHLRRRLLYTLLFGLAFITLGSLLLARYVVTPLRELQATVSGFSETQPAVGEDKQHDKLLKRQDAIGDLARSYDVMSQQVTDVLNSQKLALHALSHELRTPLTRLALMASMAEDDVNKTPKLVCQIETEIQRMNQLIGRITQLARLESGTQAIETQPVVVKTLLEECLDGFSLDVTQAHVDVQVREHGQQEAVVAMDKGLAMIALSNVIKNALAYAKSNVRITLHTNAAGFDVIVEDDGVGIEGIDTLLDVDAVALPPTPTQLHPIFDAFYRRGVLPSHGQKTNAQAQSLSQHNVGLGLSIVHRIMNLHHGEVAAYRSALGGLAVRLYFPR